MMNLVNFRYSGKLSLREQRLSAIYRLENEILLGEQVDCSVRNFFAPGVYCREMVIPPWTVITGAVHTTDHLAILTQGVIEVETPEGMQLFTAPAVIRSPAGIKRAGRTFGEGATWITVHENADNCTDLDVVVERISTSKNCDLLGNRPKLKEVTQCL